MSQNTSQKNIDKITLLENRLATASAELVKLANQNLEYKLKIEELEEKIKTFTINTQEEKG